jgi:hypothetical chaperone protein
LRADLCGLDFGTSNSEAGILRDGRPVLVAVEGDWKKIPTTIFFDTDTRADFFGEEAIARFLEGHAGRMMWAIKSVLGTAMQTEATIVRGRRMTFEDVIARILINIREKANAAAGTSLTSVVMGRPVRFNDRDEQLDLQAETILRRCAGKAGFEHVEVELEPIAAAIEFETHIEREQIGVVVDIGGGTSDFTVIRLQPANANRSVGDRSRILSVGGLHVGGTDFDRQLSVDRLMPELGLGASYKDNAGNTLEMPQWVFHDLASWLRINFIYDSRMLDGIYAILAKNVEHDRRLRRLDRVLTAHQGHALARIIEAAKIDLSDRDEVRVALDLVERHLSLSITRAQLEAAIADLLERIESTLMSVVTQSGVRTDDITVVFFTGGGSLLPDVRTRVGRLLPHARSVDTDQFGGIALGLAMEAQRIFA